MYVNKLLVFFPNKFLVDFSYLVNKMNNSYKIWRRVYCYDSYEPSFPVTCV